MRRLSMCSIALFVLAVGCLNAQSNRVFELRVYRAVPGKIQALEARFRDTTAKLLAKHDIHVLGYWTGQDAEANSFYWLVGHASREEAKQHYQALANDPAFQAMVKSEQQEKLVEKVESIFLTPADFSAIK